MHGIFISYRREDAAGYAGRLYDRLAAHFGDERVFMDVEGIEPGADFFDAIERAVGSCEALIVMIGSEWLAADSAGHRRLDDPADFVRLETATALARGIRVVPVLVDGAVMPRADQLPKELAPLTRRQAVELSHKQWDATTAELIRTLEKILNQGKTRVAKTAPAEPTPQAEPQRSEPQPLAGERRFDRRYWGIGAVLVLGAASALLYLTQPWREDTTPPPAPAVLRVTPGQVEFAEQPLRVAGAASVITLANGGGAPLRLRSVKIEGQDAADFKLSESQCSERELGPGETCTIKVTFIPQASGMRVATLAIAAEGTSTVPTVSVQGRGAESVAAVATPPPDKSKPPPAGRPTPPPERKPEVATAPPKILPPPPAQLITVPDQVGKSRRDAIAELEKAGLEVRVIEDKPDSSASRAVDSVVSQLPKGGEQLKAGGRVTLHVAAAPASAAPAPAPAAPAPAPAAVLATAFPRVGDTWQYRVRSMWKNVEDRTFVHQVTAVSEREVRETMSEVASGDNASEGKSFGPDPRFVEWRGKGFHFVEFNPFLQVFGQLQPDTAWKSLTVPVENPSSWYSQGRVRGWDSISVPAGSFKALRVELNSSRAARASSVQEPQRVQYVIWYASDAKRTIKHVRTVYTASGSKLDEETYELMKYRVQ
ncbi:MAG TPA: choice-of-anchor D domain-containing protein [Casimicrobiaceae bacterium]|nr:choice-of-anchor D domain-containing protein [Casimicrobiaceae bacterium]